MYKSVLTGFVVFVVCGLFCNKNNAFSSTLNLFNIFDPALSESHVGGINPVNWEAADFEIIAKSDSDPKWGQFELVVNSLEWARVSDQLLVPRALIRWMGQSNQTGYITYQRRQYPIQQGHAEIMIALLDQDPNEIEVKIFEPNHKKMELQKRLIFKPKKRAAISEGRFPLKSYLTQTWSHFELGHTPAIVDTSCSPYFKSVNVTGFKDSEWVYLGCRVINSQDQEGEKNLLQIYGIPSGVKLALNGSDPLECSRGYFELVATSDVQSLELSTLDNQKLKINLSMPKKINRAFLGLGIGPYFYEYKEGAEHFKGVIPLATLYGSYTIAENTRIVAFDATTLHHDLVFDFGVYANYESIRILDKRAVINILLGGHILGILARNGTHEAKFSAPQGIEVIYKDSILQNYNLSLGGFFYPPIEGRSYYNLWARWGSSRLFYEINYISWKEPILNGNDKSSTNIGITLGFPLARFF